MQVSPTTITEKVLSHSHMALQKSNSVKTPSRASRSPEFKEKSGKQIYAFWGWQVSSVPIRYALVTPLSITVALSRFLHHLLVICFTTMSVIRNFPYYSRILYSEQPSQQETASHCCLPCSGLKELLLNNPPPLHCPHTHHHPPPVFFRILHWSYWILGFRHSLPTNQAILRLRAFILAVKPATFALIEWATCEMHFRRWQAPAASGEVLSSSGSDLP